MLAMIRERSGEGLYTWTNLSPRSYAESPRFSTMDLDQAGDLDSNAGNIWSTTLSSKKTLRAIDLYSGVGGWALGMRLAGIDVVASYERWGPANETNFKNNQHQAQTVDIRRLDFSELPRQIDIVVGSPPCTQFSYANRGGNGDLADGLMDIIRFFEIIDYVRPRCWAMENVPRVASILEAETSKGGALARFAHLGIAWKVLDLSAFGVPQRRKRCIAGNFNFDLLQSYVMKAQPAPTLGAVMNGLAGTMVSDPNFSLSLHSSRVTDHVTEPPLTSEEIRINHASKTLHPVYNTMAFPDRLDRPVRTITATCTRVSRESIIVASNSSAETAFRRLTLRERACLQGFPITYQFYASTYAQRLRMIGNAVPPIFTYYVGHALRGTPFQKLTGLSHVAMASSSPVPLARSASPETPSLRYPMSRNFRFAVPSLRLKSGVRFELRNDHVGDETHWRVSFFFGTPKSIQTINLNEAVRDRLIASLPLHARAALRQHVNSIQTFIRSADVSSMQRVWTHRGPGATRPFMLLDFLDRVGTQLQEIMRSFEPHAQKWVGETILAEYGSRSRQLLGLHKVYKNAVLVFCGLLIGSTANCELHGHTPQARRRAANDSLASGT